MLTIKSTTECAEALIEIDYYVPFSVEFGMHWEKQSDRVQDLLYWRGGDGQFSLIEIGINRSSGKIQSITLASINKEKVSYTEEEINESLPETDGLISFNINDWKVKSHDFSSIFKDEFDCNFSLTISKNYLRVSFCNSENSSRYVRNDQVRFGISNTNVLSSIELTGLTSGNIQILKESID